MKGQLAFSAASVYTGYEVDDDWCVSVLQSYQADREVPFPWSVGGLGAPLCAPTHDAFPLSLRVLTLSLSPGEDMTLEGRRQLALFLVSWLCVAPWFRPALQRGHMVSCLF